MTKYLSWKKSHKLVDNVKLTIKSSFSNGRLGEEPATSAQFRKQMPRSGEARCARR